MAKLIPLSKRGKHAGKYSALVDDEMYDELSQYNWSVLIDGRKVTVYAIRGVRIDGVDRVIRMHDVVMGGVPKKGYVHDHRNGDTLDNRKENLRIRSVGENAKNTRKHREAQAQYDFSFWEQHAPEHYPY